MITLSLACAIRKVERDMRQRKSKITTEITPIEENGKTGVLLKREDFAYRDDPVDKACGLKVRQYMKMMAAHPGKPLVVGCSADSCQQIYIADAVNRSGRSGYVFIPKRKVLTEATDWTLRQGVNVTMLPHGYPSVYRAEARAKVQELNGAVRWNVLSTFQDVVAQCVNIPDTVKRIVVPTGSGLVAAAIASAVKDRLPVVMAAVSPLAKISKIEELACKFAEDVMFSMRLSLVRHRYPYGRPKFAVLEDGTILDPFYAAKALEFCQPGDLLWITGCRPLVAMPRGER